VVENGMETVNKIVKDDGIISITIIRKGEAAKKFDAVKVFSNYFTAEAENQKKKALVDAENRKIYQQKYKDILSKKVAYFEKIKAEGQTTASGLTYKIIKKGNGKKPVQGSYVFIDYAGYFEDGVLFDTSNADVAKEFGKFDENRAAQNGYSPIPLMAGQRQGVIPGFLEGVGLLSYGDKIVLFIPPNIGFGEAGYNDGAIPPNTNLIFELEMFEKTARK
jgi:peptidylprolyl isomerase